MALNNSFNNCIVLFKEWLNDAIFFTQNRIVQQYLFQTNGHCDNICLVFKQKLNTNQNWPHKRYLK